MRPRVSSLALAAAFAGILAACPGPPQVGEFGRFRYVGRVLGEAPLDVLPPVADASGAIYTLAGRIDLPQVAAFVSRVGGGEVSGCTLTKGDAFGAHGWVGFTAERQFYWAGDALVEMTALGGCRRVLDRDPATDADLQFKAVLPWVRDAPSRRTLVALVRSPVDAAPFSVVVDLDAHILSNVRPFDPPDATDVQVIGVGALRETNTGFAVVQYRRGDDTLVEGRFYDEKANETARVPLRTSAPLVEYGIRGYLEVSDSGLVVGLLAGERDEDPRSLVAFDRESGRIVRLGEGLMNPVGVHRWEGKLYLVGTSQRRPVIAELGEGAEPGAAAPWEASELAASALRGPLTVLDDRSRPARETVFPTTVTAIGDFPFLSAHSPTRHAPGTTLWLVAGPSFDTGGSKITSIAMAPVGIEYP